MVRCSVGMSPGLRTRTPGSPPGSRLRGNSSLAVPCAWAKIGRTAERRVIPRVCRKLSDLCQEETRRGKASSSMGTTPAWGRRGGVLNQEEGNPVTLPLREQVRPHRWNWVRKAQATAAGWTSSRSPTMWRGGRRIRSTVIDDCIRLWLVRSSPNMTWSRVVSPQRCSSWWLPI